MTVPKLHLASISPRRQEILTALGLTFSSAGVDLDERRINGESAQDMVLRLAQHKAAAATVKEPTVVIAADTTVVLGGKVYGKPVDRKDCLAMLQDLSGRTHQVVTGVAVRSTRGVQTALSTTEVQFREISPDEALAYWQSGEPRDKAGAYAIQGKGGVFVAAISGSYSGVVGLPVFETAGLLRDAGLNILQVSEQVGDIENV
jgi:septum formation protein